MECPGNDPEENDCGGKGDGDTWFGSDGIAETLVARPDKIKHCRRKYDYVFKKESGRRSVGVAFMANSETSRAVLGYNQVSLRVITKPVNITFVQVYAPIGASSAEEITAFYE